MLYFLWKHAEICFYFFLLQILTEQEEIISNASNEHGFCIFSVQNIKKQIMESLTLMKRGAARRRNIGLFISWSQRSLIMK